MLKSGTGANVYIYTSTENEQHTATDTKIKTYLYNNVKLANSLVQMDKVGFLAPFYMVYNCPVQDL